jgi:hypothetical protein
MLGHQGLELANASLPLLHLSQEGKEAHEQKTIEIKINDPPPNPSTTATP